jgi:hypothetical protein
LPLPAAARALLCLAYSQTLYVASDAIIPDRHTVYSSPQKQTLDPLNGYLCQLLIFTTHFILNKTYPMIEEFLSSLKNVYLQPRPSATHGIGLFAIRDIPKGCREMFSKGNEEWIKVPIAEVEQLPEYSKQLVYNYSTFDDEFYYVEKYGFKKLDIVSFLNHSDNPDLIVINNGEFFEAARDIKAGEEVFINYGDIAG